MLQQPPAAWELRSCSDARPPKASPERHDGSFWALLIAQDPWSSQEGAGVLLIPPLGEEEVPGAVEVATW